ncbi:hypothetical protein KUCAC02_024114, partial [Chaenocephalus aceratus]
VQWSLGLDVTLSTAVSLLSSFKIRMFSSRSTGQSTCVMLSGWGAQSPPSHAGHAMEQTLHTYGLLSRISNTPLPLNSVISPCVKELQRWRRPVFTLP